MKKINRLNDRQRISIKSPSPLGRRLAMLETMRLAYQSLDIETQQIFRANISASVLISPSVARGMHIEDYFNSCFLHNLRYPVERPSRALELDRRANLKDMTRPRCLKGDPELVVWGNLKFSSSYFLDKKESTIGKSTILSHFSPDSQIEYIESLLRFDHRKALLAIEKDLKPTYSN